MNRDFQLSGFLSLPLSILPEYNDGIGLAQASGAETQGSRLGSRRDACR